MVVVIGCPRSGTGFISQLLKEHDLDVGHEVWGRKGIADWRLTWQKPKYTPLPRPPKSPKLPIKLINLVYHIRSPFRTDYPDGERWPAPLKVERAEPALEPEPEEAEPEPVEANPTYTIVHQVRHPLNVIASLVTIAPESWELIACHTRLTVDDPPLTRSMMAWLYLNELAECRAEYSYRVENIRQEFDEICRRAGFAVDLKSDYKTPENENGREHSEVTWDMLEAEDAKLTERVKVLAVAYGYAL